jgi:hypothetical protein
VDKQPPTTGEATIMVAGVVMLIGSFLDFLSAGPFGRSSWGSGLFPVATLLPLYGVIMAVQIALTKFARVELPARVLGYTWEQVHLLLGLFALIMGIAWFATDFPFLNRAIGFWLLFLGSIALAVGAFMLQRERNTGAVR